jgi:hypothetical protein
MDSKTIHVLEYPKILECLAVLLILCISLFAISACDARDVSPKPSATFTSTPILPTATNTPTATLTPTPSQTPLPSATPTCPPRPDSQTTLNTVQEETTALIPGARVTWYDDFKCQDLSYGWVEGSPSNPSMKIDVFNSVVTLYAQKVENIWDGITRTSVSLGDNKGFLILFRYQVKTTANLFFHTGTWQAPDYKRWGFSTTNVPTNVFWQGWQGTNWLSSYIPRRVLRPDEWYYLFVRMGKSGRVIMRVWEKDDPTNHADFQKRMSSNWIGQHWQFIVQVYEGTVEIDEYQEISFDNP